MINFGYHVVGEDRVKLGEAWVENGVVKAKATVDVETLGLPRVFEFTAKATPKVIERRANPDDLGQSIADLFGLGSLCAWE